MVTKREGKRGGAPEEKREGKRFRNAKRSQGLVE
jgi:hypothetical protein